MDIARSPPRFRLRRSHIALRVAALTVSVVAIAALGLGRAGPPGGGALQSVDRYRRARPDAARNSRRWRAGTA
ncbi:hypothetical protein DZA55_17435 [Xanthomonas oryzae pv. oryzae]|nr:hypothetical protein B4599_04555 [Xanthomonas oryzae pv. oryzae]QBA15635.1 hypothetical protein DZA55_17435 [Xanthomonas oryzae pv. oryzae]QBN93731.1 hypothetical protein EBA19_04825 [Xanthomonas oryzae pv. oryzae]QBO01466.1 hypothetical protein EBA21_04610 [Xanthomonas oryzae pv. oryzae]QBO09095.1 hypothetical protein EBA23_04680 [Xanthomonas oryzae pv. oryzae]